MTYAAIVIVLLSFWAGMRKLHIIRPDLMHYPLLVEVFA